MVIKKGELITGRKALHKKTGISERSIRTGLTILKMTNTIAIKTTNKFSIISILNWEEYQAYPTKQMTNEVTNKRPASDQPVTTNNNDKNEKNERKEDTSINWLLKLSDTDVEGFTKAFICNPKQVVDKGQSLYDYCKAKGKVYKDYRAFLRNALRRDFGTRTILSKEAISLPPEEISEEQRLKNIQRLAEIKKKYFDPKIPVDSGQ